MHRHIQAVGLLPLLHGALDQGLHWVFSPPSSQRLVDHCGHGVARLRAAHVGSGGRRDEAVDIKAAPTIGRHQPLVQCGGAGQQHTVCLFGQHALAHAQVTGNDPRVRGVPVHYARGAAIRLRRRPRLHGSGNNIWNLGDRGPPHLGQSGAGHVPHNRALELL